MPDSVGRLLIVSYQLTDPAVEDSVGGAIRDASTAWWHHLDHTWIIRSEFTAVLMRDHLRSVVTDSDRLFVADISESSAAWRGFSERGAVWLTNNVS